MSSQPLRVRVQNGQLVLDQPVELSEGEIFFLVPAAEVNADDGDELDEEERAALHRELELSVEDFKAGRVHSAEEVMAELRARAEK